MKSRVFLPFAGLLVCGVLLVSSVMSGPTVVGGTEDAIADALAKNGSIFVDWPKPRLAIVLTGALNGYVEPCGCAGLDNQKGGLKRRYTFLEKLRDEDGWPVVALDAGGLVRRVGPQAETKYRHSLESLVEMKYSAIGLGANELQLSADSILFALANLDPETNPLVSANVGVFGFDNGFTHRFLVIEAGGMRVGVTSVVGASKGQQLAGGAEIQWVSPEKGLKIATAALRREKCDLQVLLVDGSPDEAVALEKKFPQFDYVAATDGAEEPADRLKPIQGTNAQLIETGHKGMYALVLGIYGKDEPVRYQRVPLDHRFADAPAMQQKLVDYQKELEAKGFDGLGLLGSGGTGMARPDGEYVGSRKCSLCHHGEYQIFERTTHATALDTLTGLDPPRHYDPECVSCHVVGWDPQGYFPYASGYLGIKETPKMKHTGCENCHGPGAAHTAAEILHIEGGEGDEKISEEELEALRAGQRMKIVENEGNHPERGEVLGDVVNNCLKCHDTDNSPAFDFREYWPKVEH